MTMIPYVVNLQFMSILSLKSTRAIRGKEIIIVAVKIVPKEDRLRRDTN